MPELGFVAKNRPIACMRNACGFLSDCVRARACGIVRARCVGELDRGVPLGRAKGDCARGRGASIASERGEKSLACELPGTRRGRDGRGRDQDERSAFSVRSLRAWAACEAGDRASAIQRLGTGVIENGRQTRILPTSFGSGYRWGLLCPMRLLEVERA